MEATQKLVDFAAGVEFDRLPPEAVQQAKLLFLDWTGCILAARHSPPAKIVADWVRDMGGAPEARLVGRENLVPAVNAALANGTASHTVEFDDIFKDGIYHPGAPVHAAALAAGQKARVSGRRLIEAIVAGYELSTRIAAAVNPAHYQYWHTTGTVGTFGAAAAAGRVYGFTPRRHLDAMGNAGTQAAGLVECMLSDSMAKPLHAGKAAASGLLSAELAARGFSGPDTILEGEKGFLRAFAPSFDLDRLTAGLGEYYNTCRMTFKNHASCGHTHAAIDAAMKLRREHGVKPQDIASISIQTYATSVKLTGKLDPRTAYEAKFSVAYCVNAAFKWGSVRISAFGEESLFDREVRELLSRTAVSVDPDIDRLFPGKRGARVALGLRDGRSIEATMLSRKGDPENPLSREEIIDKFYELAGLSLDRPAAERLLENIMGMENLEDVRNLV